MAYVWPIVLVVVSNILYQICAKSVPAQVSPFAALTVTYLVGAAVSAAMFVLFDRGDNLILQYRQMNWAPFVLGLVIVGLEVGFIFVYKAGWPVSTASVVQSAFLAVALMAVGNLLYGEVISWNKLIGGALCLIGLVFINKP